MTMCEYYTRVRSGAGVYNYVYYHWVYGMRDLLGHKLQAIYIYFFFWRGVGCPPPPQQLEFCSVLQVNELVQK